MKKKYLIILIILLLIAAAGAVIGFLNYRQYTRLFQDTDYPVSYKIKNGSIIITVKDKTGRNEVWEAVSEDPDIVSVVSKKKVSAKKATFTLSPVMAGVTNVSFHKSVQSGDIKVDYIDITFGTYASESPEGLVCYFLDEGTMETGKDIIGAATEHPVVLSQMPDESDEYMIDEVSTDTDATDDSTDADFMKGHIDFINGRGDWNIESDIPNVNILYNSDNNREYAELQFISDEDLVQDDDTDRDEIETDTKAEEKIPLATNTEPSWDDIELLLGGASEVDVNTATDATEITGEAVLTFSSESLGITEKRKVTFFKDGHVKFDKSDK